MQSASIHFKQRAKDGLNNQSLQTALKKAQGKFVHGRAQAVESLGNFEEIRNYAVEIRNQVLEKLDLYLEHFERQAEARGTIVHWAKNPEEVQQIVLQIAKQNQVKKVVKSKSMVTEECALNSALEEAGLQVVETDLGEYIIQLAKEPPSHIVAPAVHKSKEEVADLFEQFHKTERKTEIDALTREAREVLREHFLTADMGISGANFVIAETGSIAIFTNEGNGRLVTTLPKVHVAITGIEKVVPTLEDLAILARLLPRSATGQPITNYVSLITGKAQCDIGDDGKVTNHADGPQEFHVILVDNGRSDLIGTEMQDMLRCIRCGACMNHCPVYQNIGGHAYGWVYPGPMGSVLTPSYIGTDQALDLPQASTFCGKCEEVCPVKIPLPQLMRNLRNFQFENEMRPKEELYALKAWKWLSLNSTAYDFGTRFFAKIMPFWNYWGNWGSDGRTMPKPKANGETFREIYRSRYGDSRRDDTLKAPIFKHNPEQHQEAKPPVETSIEETKTEVKVNSIESQTIDVKKDIQTEAPVESKVAESKVQANPVVESQTVETKVEETSAEVKAEIQETPIVESQAVETKVEEKPAEESKVEAKTEVVESQAVETKVEETSTEVKAEVQETPIVESQAIETKVEETSTEVKAEVQETPIVESQAVEAKVDVQTKTTTKRVSTKKRK